MRNKTHNTRLLRIVACLLFLLPLASVVRAGSADSVTVTFRFVAEKDMFFSPYKGNDVESQRLFRFVEGHRKAIATGELPLHVDGYCNSGRSEQASLAIARKRSNRVKSELITKKGLVESNFITHNHATEGDFVTVRIRLPKENVAVTEDKQLVSEEETAQLRPENGTVTETTPKAAETSAYTEKENQCEPVQSVESVIPKISLRANLLRWATLTPDLGIEWRINRDWSVLVNGTWTSWSWDDRNRRYALWKVSPEVRYHIDKEKRGYLGAMYHAGGFNYKLSGTGKQGDLMGGGLTGGYLLKLNKVLSLDFSIGVGCTHADYDKYVLTDGVRVKQGNDSKNYWGVNHLGVSLVWNIGK